MGLKKFIPPSFMPLKIDPTMMPQTRPVGKMKLFLSDISERGLKPNYILDVGAHFAGWSREAQSVFPDANFYLIEPLIEMESDLKQFCEDFPGSKYFLNGVGPKKEKIYLTIVADLLATANCMYQENEYFKTNNWQREIQIITIDSLLDEKEMEIPDLVKIDIQGFELEALKGATELFGKTEIFILEVSLFSYVEGMPIYSEVICFMAERGYEVYDFPGFYHRPYDGALGQVDVCFVKKDGYLRASNAWNKRMRYIEKA